jgi:ERCC4-related helicase
VSVLSPSSKSGTEDAKDTPAGENHSFKTGDMVIPLATPDKTGMVSNVIPGSPEDTIQVFIDSKIQPYYASQLRLSAETETETLTSERFFAYLTALEIRQPGMSNLYSLNAARVDFIPYQFRPVLRFIKADRPRMLIADSVGVGKTIEAGLILRELQARKEMRSILIICPRPLVTESKWLNEMKRFDEDFIHLDGKTLRYCVSETDKEGVWPDRYEKAIIPYSLLDGTLVEGNGKHTGLDSLDPPPKFDLVIVDEAHHIKNPATFGYRAVKYFCDNAEAAIFLTATPIQLGSNDLFVLLNLLRPDIIIDSESFNHMAELNPYINSAVSAMREQNPDWPQIALDYLNQAAATPWGMRLLSQKPDFTRIKSELAQKSISQKDRVKIITETENLHTFSGIINRTRRRDIGDFTTRKPQTVNIPFTPAQAQLHNSLLSIQEKILRAIHGDGPIAFMMTTIRQQAASCIFGLKPFLDDILHRRIDELYWDEIDDSYEAVNNSFIASIKSDIETLIKTTETLDEYDPKCEELFKIIAEKQKFENNRIMLFSRFRHTLYYLFEKLQNSSCRVGLIHGDIPDAERVSLCSRFQKDRAAQDALDILLFSEVGCEGLDYQFCDCMINYDLPWNPMRIEQRIGRIDRKGQNSPAIAIYNMITPGTIDGDVYERCLWRIGVFEKSIGDCEEILGEITKELKDIAADFTLDEAAIQKKLDVLADNQIRDIQETQKLEDEKYNFLGIQLTQEQLNNEIEDAANYWLKPESLYRFVNLYLRDMANKDTELILGNGPLKTLRLSSDVRSGLLADYRKNQNQKNALSTKWEKWLKGGDQHLSITFESDCAANQPDAAFIMPLHPLVRQAAEHFITKKKVLIKLRTSSNLVPPDSYIFSIYQWTLHGVREDQLLKYVTESPVIIDHVENLVRESDNQVSYDTTFDMPEASIKILDDNHYTLWNEAKEAHIAQNKQIIRYQQESLTISHNARMALLNEQLQNATNDKIRRMKQGEITAGNL